MQFLLVIAMLGFVYVIWVDAGFSWWLIRRMGWQSTYSLILVKASIFAILTIILVTLLSIATS